MGLTHFGGIMAETKGDLDSFLVVVREHAHLPWHECHAVPYLTDIKLSLMLPDAL